MSAAMSFAPGRVRSRGPLTVACAVWRALILREAGARLFAGRATWVWVFAEPACHVGYLLVLFTAVHFRQVSGLDTVIWLMIGLQGYFLFRKTSESVSRATAENSALFAYRQVGAIDPLIARALLEAAINLVVTAVLIAGLALFDHPLAPDQPLLLLGAFFALWVFGFGVGLMIASIVALAREARMLLAIVLRPLYLISGVILPLANLPPVWRRRMMWNPVADGVEVARMGISRFYHAVPETSPAWLYGAALGSVVLGLALQHHFADRMIER